MQPSPEPRPRTEAEVLAAVSRVIDIFRSGLPEIEVWKKALLAIPFEHWNLAMDQDCGLVRETYQIHYAKNGVVLEGEFTQRSEVLSDLSVKISREANMQFNRGDSGSQATASSIVLNKFPDTIALIIDTLRERLIEKRLFDQRISDHLAAAREWQSSQQWGLSVLDRALEGDVQEPKEQLSDRQARQQAEEAFRRLRPPNEFGDWYEAGDLLDHRVFEAGGAVVTLVHFEGFFCDQHGNEDASDFLYVVVAEGGRDRKKEVEFIFDSCFDGRYQRTVELLNKRSDE